MGYYIADIYYGTRKIDRIIVGEVADKFPEMSTYAPSEYTFYKFKGLEYEDGHWTKETNGSISVMEYSTKYRSLKHAKRSVIKLIFSEDSEE